MLSEPETNPMAHGFPIYWESSSLGLAVRLWRVECAEVCDGSRLAHLEETKGLLNGLGKHHSIRKPFASS